MSDATSADDPSDIQIGYTQNPSEREAVAELGSAILRPDTGFVVFFCSAEYSPSVLAEELVKVFKDVPMIGCTTAGEISPAGYLENSLVGVSFPKSEFTAASVLVEDLSQFMLSDTHTLVNTLIDKLNQSEIEATPENTFALMLIDGLFGEEERVVSSFYGCLGGVPLVGGSAGDSLHFKQTRVFWNGQFYPGAAVLTMIRTTRRIAPFMSQSFASTPKRMVVTQAEPSKRRVLEINGEPAGWEYARLVGVKPEELGPSIFSNYPLAVRVGGADFIRSVQKVDPDGSLTFFCAIDNGIVMSLVEPTDFIGTLTELFRSLNGQIGKPSLVLGCDCVFRKLNVQNRQLFQEVRQLFGQNNVLGFNTYGEQFNSMHVNQTFTGVAIGQRNDRG